MKLLSRALLVLAFGVTGISVAQAEYPDRPIKLIVNFSAGGSTDTAARLMLGKVSEVLGTDTVVMNKPGAGGTLGIAETARSRPNGYTIGTANMPAIGIIPQIRDVPYDPFQDVVQIAAVMPYEYALLVRDDAPWTTWEEFVEHVKANPGEVTYGSVGNGTTNHLVTARIGKELGFEWKHVPFQGGVKATAALMGGHVDVINNTMASVASSLEAGELRALLVTSESRFSLVPDVPTMEEAGFDFSQISYMSIIGPKGFPEEAREKIEAAFRVAAQDQDVRDAMGKLDLHPQFVSGNEYETLLKRLHGEWGQVLSELDIVKNN
jgi:tripartite-type tricarboxylate transporter receptor subunit TctC